MSTIASPRASLSRQSPDSSRSSFENTSRSSSRAPTAPAQRKNRAALRDYYGLKSTAPANVSSELQREDGLPEEDLELDKEGFNAEKYVQDILERDGLQTVLKVESGLVGDIRGLDGERKALVYDNYSKLIAATETIMKMKNNMDPLGPVSSTLAPTIAHIANTSASLSAGMVDKVPASLPDPSTSPESSDTKQLRTVRWVLDTPQRLIALISAGKREYAESDYAGVSQLLDKWNGVDGVEEIRQQCGAIFKGSSVVEEG